MSTRRRVKILVFGNPMLKDDSLPVRLIGKLRKRFPDVEFKEFDPNENLEDEGRDLRIIDAVEGINRVTLITDIGSLKTGTVYSMHDFDLGYSLKLLKKLHYIDTVKIFGVPMRISESEALKQLETLIASDPS